MEGFHFPLADTLIPAANQALKGFRQHTYLDDFDVLQPKGQKICSIEPGAHEVHTRFVPHFPRLALLQADITPGLELQHEPATPAHQRHREHHQRESRHLQPETPAFKNQAGWGILSCALSRASWRRNTP